VTPRDEKLGLSPGLERRERPKAVAKFHQSREKSSAATENTNEGEISLLIGRKKAPARGRNAGKRESLPKKKKAHTGETKRGDLQKNSAKKYKINEKREG